MLDHKQIDEKAVVPFLGPEGIAGKRKESLSTVRMAKNENLQIQ